VELTRRAVRGRVERFVSEPESDPNAITTIPVC